MKKKRKPFNRTKLELKSLHRDRLEDASSSFNRTKLELKFDTQQRLLLPCLSFNRTKLELKLSFRDFRSDASFLLIAPSWN